MDVVLVNALNHVPRFHVMIAVTFTTTSRHRLRSLLLQCGSRLSPTICAQRPRQDQLLQSHIQRLRAYSECLPVRLDLSDALSVTLSAAVVTVSSGNINAGEHILTYLSYIVIDSRFSAELFECLLVAAWRRYSARRFRLPAVLAGDW